MALTDEQLAYLAVELGTDFDIADAEDRFTRLEDVILVAHEVVAQRLADLLTGPTSFSISGVYSENNAGQVAALRAQLASLAASAGIGGGVTVGRMVRGGGR